METLTVDFEFDPGRRSPYSEYVCDTPLRLVYILGSIKTVVGFGYFTRALYEMQASIQLIIVTAGPSLIDFLKALLAETGAKKDI